MGHTLVTQNNFVSSCDNQAVRVQVWESGLSQSAYLMVFFRALFFIAASHNFNLFMRNLPGSVNCIADALSCQQLYTGSDPLFPKQTPSQPPPPCRVDVHLHQCLFYLQQQGIAKSTCRTYQSSIRAYRSFCGSYGLDQMPASELTLRYFIAFISQTVTYPTIRIYLSAVRLMHLKNQLSDPLYDRQGIHYLCQAVRRSQPSGPPSRLPILPRYLKAIKSQLSKSSYQNMKL